MIRAGKGKRMECRIPIAGKSKSRAWYVASAANNKGTGIISIAIDGDEAIIEDIDQAINFLNLEKEIKRE